MTTGVLKRDVAATFTGSVIAMLVSVANSVILARVLGPANRGLLGLALLIPTIASTFCILGQEMVNATFGGLYKDKRSSLFQQSLIITLFGTAVSVLVICLFYFWLPINKGQFGKLDPNLVWLMCLFCPIVLLFRMLSGLVRGVGQIAFAAMLGVVRTGTVLVLLVVFLVWLRGGLKTAILISAVGPLGAIACSLWILRDYVTVRPSEFSGLLFKKSLGFGTQLSLATFAGFLVYRVDQGILGYYVSIEQVGLYIVAVGLAERLKLLPNSIAMAFLPRLANDLTNRQSQVPMVFRCTMIVSAGSMLVVGILGVPMIILLFGWDYSGAIPSFLLLLPGLAAIGGSSILASDLASREKPRYSVWVGYLALGVCIILNFWLIPRIGIAGSAVASSVSYIVANMMWLYFYRHESGVAFKQMIPGGADLRYVAGTILSTIQQVLSLSIAKLRSMTWGRVENNREEL